jgi:predicted RNA-binding protein with PUA-like domain
MRRATIRAGRRAETMWLLKTEPSTYSFADLERDGRAVWDGVTNPAALRNLRAMAAGDRALVYHTGDEKAAVGVAEVTKAAYPDPKSKNPRLVVVDLRPVARLPRAVSLAEIRALPAFVDSPLVKQPRLSVVALTAAQWKALGGSR